MVFLTEEDTRISENIEVNYLGTSKKASAGVMTILGHQNLEVQSIIGI